MGKILWKTKRKEVKPIVGNPPGVKSGIVKDGEAHRHSGQDGAETLQIHRNGLDGEISNYGKRPSTDGTKLQTYQFTNERIRS